MKFLQFFFPRFKKVSSFKIIWHRFIPFVIAEMINSEWKELEPLVLEGKLPILSEVYNKSGNWYVIEGLDYFFFGIQILTSVEKHFLFNDSTNFGFMGMPDEQRYSNLISQTKFDIDLYWDKLLF